MSRFDGTTKSLLLNFLCLLGLCGFGIIVFEILKKWQLFSSHLSPLWIIAPVLILFSVKQATTSPHWIHKLNLSPIVVKRLSILIKITWICLGILALISIPFLWFGVIEELASQNR
jgi:hypothetical protein